MYLWTNHFRGAFVNLIDDKISVGVVVRVKCVL